MANKMLLILLIAFAGVAREPAVETDGEMAFMIDDMRLEAEALVLEQGILSWKNRVYGDDINIAQTYEGHEKLFSSDAIKAVDVALATAKNDRERKALSYFKRYLLSEYIGKEVAPLDDTISNTEANSSVDLDGEELPYRQLYPLLATEKDYDRRQRISDAQLPVLKKLEPTYLDKERKSRELARTLGYPSYNALSEELRSFSLDRLSSQCETILSQTEPGYKELLEEITVEFMDIPLGKFRRCDILKLFQMDKFKAHFPAEKLLPGVSTTLKGMGIDLPQQKNILIHDLPLPKKNPRAACYPLKVPCDVRLTIKPTGGVSDYETMLHEMGHAQHFAHTTTDHFEFKHLGDNTVTEAYAFLFEELTDDPEWIDEYIKLSPGDRESYLRFRLFSKIYILRRYAAKLLYEKQFHADAKKPQEIYRETLSRAYGFPLDEKDAGRYLSDVDDFYYVADYLRAWFLKAQIDRVLVKRFGERWFTSAEAGKFLASLWKYGQELNGDELAKKLGYKGLDPGVLIEQLLGKQAETLVPASDARTAESSKKKEYPSEKI